MGEKSQRHGHGGLMFAAAAGLAAAAFVYMKKKGIGQKHVQVVQKHGKGLAALLKGESRAAYGEVREAIIIELAETSRPPTKMLVQRIARRALSNVKKRGELTKMEFEGLLDELTHDWQAISRESQKRQKAA